MKKFLVFSFLIFSFVFSKTVFAGGYQIYTPSPYNSSSEMIVSCPNDIYPDGGVVVNFFYTDLPHATGSEVITNRNCGSGEGSVTWNNLDNSYFGFDEWSDRTVRVVWCYNPNANCLQSTASAMMASPNFLATQTFQISPKGFLLNENITSLVDTSVPNVISIPDLTSKKPTGSTYWGLHRSQGFYPSNTNSTVVENTLSGGYEMGVSTLPNGDYNFKIWFNNADTRVYFNYTQDNYIKPVPSYGSIFFPKEPDGINTFDGNDLMASVGGATQATTGDLTLIVALIGGIILAIIAIRFIVSAFYGTDPNKKTKKRV